VVAIVCMCCDAARQVAVGS